MLKEARPDWSVPAWAFHWLMGLENVSMILSGMSTLEQIRDNVATFQAEEPLTREQNMMLMNIAAGYQSKLAVPCTACRYCCDGCPKGIDIPVWMNLYNELALTKDKKGGRMPCRKGQAHQPVYPADSVPLIARRR